MEKSCHGNSQIQLLTGLVRHQTVYATLELSAPTAIEKRFYSSVQREAIRMVRVSVY